MRLRPGRGPRWRLRWALAVALLVTLTARHPVQGAAPRPDDELFPAQWHLRAVGIPRAWEVSRGAGVVVAVLDTGVAYGGPSKQAPDLAGTRLVPGWDFVDDDDQPEDVPTQGTGSHGTHMAGTIAQTSDNGVGGAGIAPAAAIMPIRVLASDATGTGHDIALGLRFAADRGAHVANLSLGGAVDDPEIAEAVRYATAKNVTIVVSSGDDGRATVGFPAAYPEVIAVGAVRYDTSRPSYSSYGAALDLVAPGGDLEVDQNADGLDDGIVQQTLFGQPGSFCFCFKQGTSSAAAHVAGVAALVIAAGRATTPAQVRDLLLSTAADLGPPGRDDEYGAGLVQATRALGLPPADDEALPTPGTVHDHASHDHGDEPPAGGALGPRQGTPPASDREFVLPAAGDGSWLGSRRARAGLMACVVVAGAVAYLARRRARRKPGASP